MDRKTKVRLAKLQRFSWNMAKKMVGITIGAILIAIAYNALIMPYKLLSGGVSGLALAANYTMGIPVYLGIFLLNIPIFLWGLRELDKDFILYSFVGTVALIITLPLTAPFIPKPNLDIFLASIFSGLVSGLGVGIILRFGASSGGTDIISMIMKKKINVSIGAFSFIVNILVLVLSLFFFELKIALYTFISMWVGGRVVDFVLEGLNRKKSVMIISEKSADVAMKIMTDLGRGVTYLEGHGGFTGDSKQVINCVVNNFENAKLKEIVQEVDPKAFMFITDAIEVAGKGFTR